VSRFAVQIGWGDVPHLSKQQQDEMLDAFPLHEREARAKGVPMLGSGRIYPIDEAQLIIDPFEIPRWWPRAYGLDVGWNTTAAIWGAWDRDSDMLYLTSEHYMGQQPPQVHADAIKSRGDWMLGAIDPASAGASQTDGRRLLDVYREMMLSLVEAENAVEAGILACYRRMTSGRLKVFRNCVNWVREFRIYRRDEDGKVVKENDHAMDATRYLIMTGMRYATTPPVDEDEIDFGRGHGGRSSVTGY
jgi:Terminase RNaseH-like domain